MVNGPYLCPLCGKTKVDVVIDSKKKDAIAICRGCRVEQSLTYAPVFQPVDYYNKFIDNLKKKE